ncbi:hydantoinase/oxoprolinase family protein [Amycolatopsis sp.]|uniref:hydantoinase/oxoprolinase family protein n=1 Tax=Amycolatopsis sp. TaxID=37632 RepID=UPI002E08F2AE|nr:hydantoinase/oxoprolinase family protein [Amycolatopsis sp.]
MYYIGVDIGGTFTDCVAITGQGEHFTAKALSTKEDPVEGVLAALALTAGAAGTDSSTLLAGAARFGHGTTIGTNAVLERRGARVGLVATAGHGDALKLMRGHGRVAGRPIEQVYSVHGSRLPDPLIVPGAVLEVHERVDSAGKVVVGLDVEAAAAALAAFITEYELDSVAIALLWSFANPSHERTLAAVLAERHPAVFVSSSVDVSPRLGEFERTVATVINGYVGPACSRYLDKLAGQLREGGAGTPMLVMQSNGGVLPVSAAGKTSLGTIDSGPAGGLTGVAALAGVYGHENVVATDLGGTSFDIGLVAGGRPMVTDENVIDQYTYRLPHLDVRTVACGGGTIARFDEATGALRVGPESAGSEPGPACYGRGGTEPTVTDADVVLGLLRPESFLEGRMPLDLEAARAAVGRLADRLGLPVEETAAGIIEINNMRAASLIRQQTLERGHDPRDFVLYAYGGAGPVHAFGYAAEIGVREVVVPLGNGASTLSAFGIASGDIVHYRELERSLLAPFDNAALVDAVTEVSAAARGELTEAAGAGEIHVEVEALMRFREQLMHSLEVTVALPAGPDSSNALLSAFETEYKRRYGAGGTSLFQAVEVFALRARASVTAEIPPPRVTVRPAGKTTPVDSCEVFWPDARKSLPTDVYLGDALGTGVTLTGPALVELAHTTIAVPPGASLSTGTNGEIRLHLEESR